MTTEKKTGGAHKKYNNRVNINHSIEQDLLADVDKISNWETTRTDHINLAIKQYLKLKQ